MFHEGQFIQCVFSLHFDWLDNDLSKILEWFLNIRMVAKPHKLQLMSLGLKRKKGQWITIIEIKASATDHVKLFGIEIKRNLKINEHRCWKSNWKVNRRDIIFLRLITHSSRQQAQPIINVFTVIIMVSIAMVIMNADIFNCILQFKS